MDQLLTRQTVADALGIHVNSVDKLRKTDPTFPRPLYIGRRTVRFSAQQLSRWVESRQPDDGIARAARAVVAEVYR